MADNYLEYRMEDMRKGKFRPFRLPRPKRKPTAEKPEETSGSEKDS